MKTFVVDYIVKETRTMKVEAETWEQAETKVYDKETADIYCVQNIRILNDDGTYSPVDWDA